MSIKKQEVMWEDLINLLQGGAWTPSPHSHIRSDVTDFWNGAFWASIPDKPSTFAPSAHALVGAKHTASGLTIGWVVKATGATTFAWGQLPHDKLGGLGDDDHTQYHNDTRGDTRYYTKTQINTYLEDQDELAEMNDVYISSPQDNQILVYNLSQAEWQNAGLPSHSHDHDNLTNVTEDQHHSEIHAVTHKSVGGDAIRIDELKIGTDITTLNSTTSQHGLLPKLYGGIVRFLAGDGTWQVPDVEWHATTHELAGDDEVSHDALLDFVTAEHLSLPNTIANVLSNHNLAEHDGLGIDHGSLGGRGDDDHTQYHNDARGDTRYYTKTQINTYLEAQDELSEMDDVFITSPQDNQVLTYSSGNWINAAIGAHSHDHDNLTNVTDDQHHSSVHAVTHHSAGADAIRIDNLKEGEDNADLDSTTTRHGLLRKLYGGTTRFLRGDGTWQITPGGTPDPHASDHELGGSDEVDHDALLGFVAGEHFLQSAITEVGTVATGIWEATDIDWAYISKAGSNLTHLATRQHAGLTDITSDQHHAISHEARHRSGGADALNHDNLAGFLVAEHLSLPNSMTNVINSGHDKALHDALNIDADTLDAQHGSYYRNAGNLNAGIVPSARLSPTQAFYATDPLLPVTNEVHSTLSGPTIAEISIPSSPYIRNNLQFVVPIIHEYTLNGVDWFTTSYSVTQLKRWVGGRSMGGNLVIPSPTVGEWEAVRFTFQAPTYNYMNWLYLYISSGGHQMNFKIEKSYGAETDNWSQVAQTSNSGGWPNHKSIPHTNVPWHSTGGTPGTHSKYMRLTVYPVYSGSYPNNSIVLYNINWYGYYPANPQTDIWYWDEDGNFYIKESLDIGVIAAGTVDYDKFLVSDGGLVKYRTGAQVLSDIGASGSGHSHAHSAITDVTSDQHHAQLHASEHHVAGGDLINHDSLTGFVTAEHVSLPNTIANVLSDHNVTVHDALNIDHGSLFGKGDDDHTQYHNDTRGDARYFTQSQVNTYLEAQDELSEMDDCVITSPAEGAYLRYSSGSWRDATLEAHTGDHDHDDLANVTSDQHHSEIHAVTHKSAGGDAIRIDELKEGVASSTTLDSNTTRHGLFPKLYGGTARFLRSDGVWATFPDADPTPHASDHEVGGDDLVSHDALTDFLATEHFLQSAITEVGTINTGVWQGTDIGWARVSKTGSNLTDLVTRQHAGLTDVTSDQHHPQSHTLASHSTRPHSALSDAPADAHHPQSHTLASHSTKPHSALSDAPADAHHPQSHTLVSHTARDHHNLIGLADDDHTQYHNDTRGDARYYTKTQINTYLEDQDELEEMNDVNITSPQDNQVLTYSSGNWINAAIGAHSHAHGDLSGVTDDQHHSKIHAVTHKSVGADAIRIDELKEGTDVSTLNSSTTRHGLLRKLYGGTVRFLAGDGTWQVPSGGDPNPHASDHEVGGSDLVGHDLLTGFVLGEHFLQSAITTVGTIATGIWEGTDIDWAYVSKTGSNLTHLATRQHAGLTDVTSNQHHPQTHTLASHTSKDHHLLAGLGDDDHTQYYNSTRHTKAIHDALNIDADTLDSISSGSFIRSDADDNVSAHTEWQDNKEARFGAGADYRIWHSGSHSYHRSYLHGANVYHQAENAGGANQTCLTIDPDFLGILVPKIRIGATYYLNSMAANNRVPDSAKLAGYLPSTSAGNNTIVRRTSSGYIYCNFLNTTSSPTTGEPTHYFVETGDDSFLRQMTPANFVAKLVGDGLMPKSGGIFTGKVEARNHGTGTVDEVVNVCYGTSDTPPAVGDVTEGTIYIKYTA